jgi:hypothetical protein
VTAEMSGAGGSTPTEGGVSCSVTPADVFEEIVKPGRRACVVTSQSACVVQSRHRCCNPLGACRRAHRGDPLVRFAHVPLAVVLLARAAMINGYWPSWYAAKIRSPTPRSDAAVRS